MSEFDFWADRWRNGNTPWDMGTAHPALPSLWEISAPWRAASASRVYIPACGRAHEGAWFAEHGCFVVAEDIVPEAIAEARRLYGAQAHLSLRIGDLFQVAAEDERAFDIAFDRAACCAFPPDEWESYLVSCARRLRPGGLLLALPFVKSAEPPPKGPPFFIQAEEWRKLAEAEFEVLFLEERAVDRPGTALRTELIAVARRL